MTVYATYITIYSGNKLPPFYIGYSKISNINNGYLGSVSSKEYVNIWKEEIKLNRNLFKLKIIRIFENKLDAIQHERKLQLFFNVHKNPMYINRSILDEKFFVSNTAIFLGRKHTEETKNKLRILAKEQYSNSVNKELHMKAFLESDGSHKNKIWINDGVKNKRVTIENYNKNYSTWNKGRNFKNDRIKPYEHNNRDPLNGRFIKKEIV